MRLGSGSCRTVQRLVLSRLGPCATKLNGSGRVGRHLCSHRAARWNVRRRWISKALTIGSGFALGWVAWPFTKNREGILNRDTFSPFQLESKQEVSSTSSILTLRPLDTLYQPNVRKELWEGKIWSVQIKQPQLQIARSYSPLPPFANTECRDSKDQSTRLLVRREPNGEMSNYLHRLSDKATIELRVSDTSYVLPGDVEEVVFLAGGTGIAPALQAAHALFQPNKEDDKDASIPKMSILWANRRRDDCKGAKIEPPSGTWWRSIWRLGPLSSGDPETGIAKSKSPIVEELDYLQNKHEGRFTIQYFVDENNRYITSKVLSSYLMPKDETNKSNGRKKLVLISGPDGFVAHFAGPKVWQKGRECQGPMGGLLKHIGISDWEIFKL